MTNHTILKALRVLFPTEVPLHNSEDLTNLSIASLFYSKYHIAIGYDYLPNLDTFVPHVRTSAYKPNKFTSGVPALYLKSYFSLLREFKGTIVQCYRTSTIIAIIYIAMEFEPRLLEKFPDLVDLNILFLARDLDKYDVKSEVEKISLNIKYTVDKRQFFNALNII